MLDLLGVQENVISILKEQIKIIRRHRRNLLSSVCVKQKERRDIVTNVDVLVEQNIVSALKELYPSHYFSTEELGKDCILNKNEDLYEWIIDPIDGTVNFAAGMDFFSISVALKHNGQTVLGVVYCFYSKEFYTVIRGKGSFCNGKRLSVSKKNSLSDSVVSFMLTSSYDANQTKKVLLAVEKLSMRTRGVRLFVSQAMELCLIAKGCLDGTFCMISHGYSCAAGLLLILEAGGYVTDIKGGNYTPKATTFVATNGLIHEEVVNMLS